MTRRFSRYQLVSCGLALALLAAMAASVSACAVCVGFPDKTDADYLIDSHCVVLARHSESNPFVYAPQQVLKGAFDDAEIPLFVDSTTRRVLAANTERRVVLVQKVPGGQWRSLGVASDDYLAVVRRIVILGPAWRDESGGQRRWEFFLPLFDHDDPSIRQLAYLEIGRAPYAIIRQVGRIAPRESYLPLLSDPQYLEWRSLAILLLAQSENPRDKQLILDSFHSAHRLKVATNLAAWAAAAIQVEGASAIDFIEAEYIRPTDRSTEELQAVAKALSMHGSLASSDLQDRIVASYRFLLRKSPQLAANVATDLYEWKRSDLVEELSAVLQQNASLGIAETQSIRRYLRAAASSEELALVRD